MVNGYEAMARRGLAVAVPKSFAELILEYAQRYLVAKSETHKTRELKRLKKHILPFFGDMAVGAITDQHMRDYIVKRRAKASNKTLRNEISTVSSIFNYAVDNGMATENPVKRINQKSLLPPLPTRVSRYISDVELNRFLEHADPECRKAVIFLRETGLRMGELFPNEGRALDISLFDLERKVLILRHQISSPLKGKRDRVIPLTETAMEILSEVKSGPIFRLKRSGFESSFYEALRKSKMKFTRHEMRHTFTSILTDGSMSPQRVSKITGHSSLYIMKAYMHDVVRDIEVIRDDMTKALGRRQGASFSKHLESLGNNASPRGFEPHSDPKATPVKTGTYGKSNS